MTTHKEQIDVPDGYTIDESPESHHLEHTKAKVVYLKPLPPPEPPIMPCPFCGREIEVCDMGENGPRDRFYLRERVLNPWCPISWCGRRYPTRAAAIEAANRRSS